VLIGLRPPTPGARWYLHAVIVIGKAEGNVNCLEKRQKALKRAVSRPLQSKLAWSALTSLTIIDNGQESPP
jgi:hypothetical protein